MRTLDDIIPPSRRASPPPPTSAPEPTPSRPRRRFPWFTAFVVLLIIAGSIGALFYFTSSMVEVTPTTARAAATGSFTAAKSAGDLPFEVITAEKIASQTVTGSGTKAVSSEAKGSLTVYNSQTVAQKLIANTRFQAASGQIFRIRSPITIPAAKNGTPGSATVTAYADKPGSEYNIGPSSFTLPGLSGSPTYTQVTAKSVTPMTGGASGNEPTVARDLELTTRAALQAALIPDLTAQIQTQVPEGYVMLPGSATTTFQGLPSAAAASAGLVDLKEQGTIRAVIFPTGALAQAIAKQSLGEAYHGEPVVLGTTAGLMLSAKDGLPTVNEVSFPFTLTGEAEVVYTVDANRIAAAIAGKSREEAEVALRNYQEIHQAVLILRPFWRGSFPEDPASIEIVVQNGAN